MIDPNATASIIGIPLEQWAGNCYSIACALEAHNITSPEFKAVYGDWLGDVSPKSRFFTRPIIRHGWLEGPDNRVIDPTRWEFEGVEPYIYEGINGGEYDRASQKRRLMDHFMQRKPSPYGTQHFIIFPDNVAIFVTQCLRPSNADACTSFSFEELHYLAHTPPNILQPHAKEIYQTLKNHGYGALIPIDSWNLVCEK